MNPKDPVFSLWNRQCRTFACYFPFDYCYAFEFDLGQHHPIHVAHPQAVDSILCMFVSPEWLLMFTKIVSVSLDAELILSEFCAAVAGCLNCTWLSKYCWTLDDLSQCLHLTLALLSLTVFSNVDIMSYTLPSFNSTDFRKPQSNKVRFIFHNSSKLRNTKVNAVMYPITPCASIVLETITVWLCSGFLENDLKDISSEGK